MRIRLFSDVHLEFGDCLLPGDSDVIVAAGDIGTGTQGVDWLGQIDIPVIYVAGNHEYYGGDLTDTLYSIKQRAKAYRNLHFLEHSSCVLDNVRFLGLTLWTAFEGLPRRDWGRLIRDQMSDYSYISKDGGPLSPEHIAALHRRGLEWLSGELERDFAGRTVVVSHHAPSMRSWHQDPQDPVRYAYCNELEALAENFSIDLWLHGHTHASKDYRMHKTRVLCNARGYYMLETLSRRPPDCVVEV